MKDIVINNWHVIAGCVYVVFVCAAGALYPPTTEQDPKLYGFFYRFVNALALNMAHRPHA